MKGDKRGFYTGCERMAECSPVQAAFFTRMIPLFRPMATRLHLDEDYLLALCAFEDAWGHDKHNDALHNLFGLTHAGGRNLGFASDQACCDYWERNYGSLVDGSTTMDAFITRIQGIGYNSKNPSYASQLKDVYNSVVRRKALCGQ